MKRFFSRLFRRRVVLAQSSGCFEVHAFEPGKFYLVLFDPTRIDLQEMDAVEWPDNIKVKSVRALFKHTPLIVRDAKAQ